MWLQEYAQSPVNQYEWSEESYTNLDKYQTMMTRLYRQELKQCIEQYEVYNQSFDINIFFFFFFLGAAPTDCTQGLTPGQQLSRVGRVLLGSSWLHEVSYQATS